MNAIIKDRKEGGNRKYRRKADPDSYIPLEEREWEFQFTDDPKVEDAAIKAFALRVVDDIRKYDLINLYWLEHGRPDMVSVY